ncbi:MAG: flagellar motor switch protein FliN [Phycisphaerales bacterium JB052]
MPDEQDTPTPDPSPEGVNESPDTQSDAAQEDAAQPGDDAEAIEAAKAAVSEVQEVADSVQSSGDTQPFAAPELNGMSGADSQNHVDLLSDVHMDVRIELGRTRMFVEDVLRLGDGAVVELDKLAGDPVDVFVNDRRVARGEVLVLNDMFCVRISEIMDITQNED